MLYDIDENGARTAKKMARRRERYYPRAIARATKSLAMRKRSKTERRRKREREERAVGVGKRRDLSARGGGARWTLGMLRAGRDGERERCPGYAVLSLSFSPLPSLSFPLRPFSRSLLPHCDVFALLYRVSTAVLNPFASSSRCGSLETRWSKKQD